MKIWSSTFHKIQRETPVLESLFNKGADPTKKSGIVQVIFMEFFWKYFEPNLRGSFMKMNFANTKKNFVKFIEFYQVCVLPILFNMFFYLLLEN